jgi:DNA-binding CsgD family transcriptional regulator
MGTTTPRRPVMRGRRRELRTVLAAIRHAKAGRSGILLVEGGHGIGRSLLLAEAVKAASEQNFSIAAGSADELGHLMPLGPLLAACAEPDGTPAEVGSLIDVPDQRMFVAARLRSRLEERAAAHPVLVSLDDLHWADPPTLQALRTLTRQLASYPVIWILARCTADDGNDADLLFDLLEKDGATRIELNSLDNDAVAALAADTLGAVPDARLLSLVKGAAGNPFMVVELLEGLKDEHHVSVFEGDAKLTAADLPARIRAVVQARLDGLSPRTRHLVKTVAVLDRTFALDDAADMLGQPPAALLPEVEEALQAGVLMATQDSIAFRRELDRRAVADMLPEPVWRALHRQYGQIVLERGGSAASAAAHLLKGADRGDAQVIAGLDQAAAEVLPLSPHTAADLALRALELSSAADPGRAARFTAAVNALAVAGRLDEAAELIRTGLAEPLPMVAAAPLRCALSTVLYQRGRAAEARREAESVLAQAGLTDRIRDEAKLALLHALAALQDHQRAADLAETILAAARQHGTELVAGALAVLSAIRWDQGHLSEGLRLSREAVRYVSDGSIESRRLHPRIELAAKLVDLGRLDEADSTVRASAAEIEALGQAPWAASSSMLTARIALADGRMDDAIAGAQASIDTASDCGLHMFTPFALGVLATVAVRQGDLRAAASCLGSKYAHAYHYALAGAATLNTMITAQIAELESGPEAAVETAGEIYARISEHRAPLVSDPALAPWLVRVALAAGDRTRAAHVADVASLVASDNPAFAGVAATASHARGLLDRDPVQIGHAARTHATPWARASAAEDAGTILAAQCRGRDSVSCLDQALAGYDRVGASRDSARVRRKLRRQGVRHRHWASRQRPATGWGSLTDTELSVSAMVSQGLTNRAVAKQMFLSENTVAFHLRQIFRKLNISSRVELTRHVIEHTQAST